MRHKPRIKTFRWIALIGLITTAISIHAFDSDGHTDVVWQNRATKEIAVWFMDKTRFVTSGRITNDMGAGWSIAAADDFNRDGQTDLLWRSPTNGHNAIWLMNGTNRIVNQPITAGSPEFNVVGTGDFNADGYTDIVWNDPGRTISAVWYMEGTNWTQTVGWLPTAAGPNWNLSLTGDFDNDGNPDLFWRDRFTGKNAIWYLDGTNLLQSAEIRTESDLSFQPAAVGAFNRFGNTDILWRHSDGRNQLWQMNGDRVESTIDLPSEKDSNWQIAGTGGYTNAMILSSRASAESNAIRLSWRHAPKRPLSIERRNLAAQKWNLLATNYLAPIFKDTNVRAGQRYEYRIGGEYLLSGTRAAPIENRGMVILVVERFTDTNLANSLRELQRDLAGDGWSVVRTNVPRHNDQIWPANLNAIASIRSFIRDVYARDPSNTKAVFLIGHIPIPYSGFNNPDGHGSRALPADGIYGDVDGIYTDSIVDSRSRLQGPHFSRHDNRIGDGKFDQNRFATNSNGAARLELVVGRVDFANLPAFKPNSESDLIQRYLRKNHRWRHKEFTLPERVSVGTFFPGRPSPWTYDEGLRIANRLYGAKPGSIIDSDTFDPAQPSVWGVLAGWGLPYGIMGKSGRYHESQHMANLNQEPRFSFGSVFGSYCVDWAYTNSLMRSFLATPSHGLAMSWFNPLPIGTVPLSFEPLGMGETIGASFLRSINENRNRTAPNSFVALMGDPTLRLQIVAPPTSLSSRSEKTVTLKWNPPLESGAAYFVYRSTNQLAGPWSRLTKTPIRQTEFEDRSPPSGFKNYQVKAVHLATTGSGTFTNLSQGIFIETK